MGMGTRAMARIGGGVAATALAAFVAAPAWAQDLLGQPTPGGIGLQPMPGAVTGAAAGAAKPGKAEPCGRRPRACISPGQRP